MLQVDRRPIKAIRPFIGYQRDTEFGLRREWYDQGRYNTAVPWLISQLNEHYESGYQRFILHLPAGQLVGPEGVIDDPPSACWETLPEVVRAGLQSTLSNWLRQHEDVKLYIYMGFRVRDPSSRFMRLAKPSATPPLVIDQSILRRIYAPWIELSDTNQVGFHLDNSSPESQRLYLIGLSNYFAADGIEIFGEAIPNYQLEDRTWDWHYTAFQAKWFGLRQFHISKFKSIKALAEVDPRKSELGFAWAGKNIFPGEYEAVAEKGYVLISYHDVQDEFILASYR
jgi:hypothetical protein